MRDYFIRRLLLLTPTLLVITMIVFAITRIAPGGPLERAMMEAQQVSLEGGELRREPGITRFSGMGMLQRLEELARLELGIRHQVVCIDHGTSGNTRSVERRDGVVAEFLVRPGDGGEGHRFLMQNHCNKENGNAQQTET